MEENTQKNIDWIKIEESIRTMTETLHKELGWLNKEEQFNTPKRVVRFYKEWIANGSFNFTTFDLDEGDNEKQSTNSMVLLKNIRFYSMCSHHLLPFFGEAFIAYLPNSDKDGEIAGVSKLVRSVTKFASKPQLQEKMSNQVADYLNKELNPWFLMVVLRANHLCMSMRGVKQEGASMVTSSIRWDKVKFTEVSLSGLKEEALRLMDIK